MNTTDIVHGELSCDPGLTNNKIVSTATERRGILLAAGTTIGPKSSQTLSPIEICDHKKYSGIMGNWLFNNPKAQCEQLIIDVKRLLRGLSIDIIKSNVSLSLLVKEFKLSKDENSRGVITRRLVLANRFHTKLCQLQENIQLKLYNLIVISKQIEYAERIEDTVALYNAIDQMKTYSMELERMGDRIDSVFEDSLETQPISQEELSRAHVTASMATISRSSNSTMIDKVAEDLTLEHIF